MKLPRFVTRRFEEARERDESREAAARAERRQQEYRNRIRAVEAEVRSKGAQ